MALTDLNCRNAKPNGRIQKLTDSGGLQLWVPPSGTRLWRLAYRFKGKQKLLAVGVYPTVSLATARDARDAAKRLLAAGIDPAADKKQRLEAAEDRSETFQVIAEEYVAKLRREGRAEATLTKTEWLLSLAYPAIGDQSVRIIKAPEVLKILRDVEARGRFESAQRLRSTLGTVFRYAIATARAEADPTIALRGALTLVKATPRAAVTDPKALGALLRAIAAFDGQPSTRIGLQLLALLFSRPGELRLAEWPEFDLEQAIWTIPAARTKMRRPHRIPLSTQAVGLLSQLNIVSQQSPLLFPSLRSRLRPISENTLNAALRRLGYAKHEATSHGFRATASSLLNESGKWHPDAVERQLGHVDNDDVRAAYARGQYWNERVLMMQWWADYLDGLRENSRRSIRTSAKQVWAA